MKPINYLKVCLGVLVAAIGTTIYNEGNYFIGGAFLGWGFVDFVKGMNVLEFEEDKEQSNDK